MSYLCLKIMRFRLLYTAIYACWQTNNIRPTYCTSQGGGKPLHLVDIRRRIHLQYEKHLGCYLFHSDMKLTIESSGHPTSFRYHLPLLFHTRKSWIHNNPSHWRADRIQAAWRALHRIRHSLAHSNNADTCWSTATLLMYPPGMWRRMHI